MSSQKVNKNEVRKEIADLINRIKEQSDRIGMQREIPQSELDLILHRIEELHRRTVVWSYLNELPGEVTGTEVTASVHAGGEKKPLEVNTTPEQVLKNDTQAEKFEAPSNPEPVVTNASPETRNAEPVIQNPQPEIRSTKPLKDIRTFIGFNEKLMYIRQVFGGDNAAYDETLNQINAMSSFEEAEAFLSVLAGEYKWNKDSEPVGIFLQTVKRRFS